MYNKSIPAKSKEIYIGENWCPWVDKNIKCMIKQKHRLLNLYRLHAISKEYFNDYCKLLKKEILYRKSQYFLEKII